MSNIFDLKNIDDIPSDISNSLNSHELEYNILHIFNIAKRPLIIDEVVVGYYRTFKNSKKRSKPVIMNRINSMIKSNKLIRISHGVYKLKEQDNE